MTTKQHSTFDYVPIKRAMNELGLSKFKFLSISERREN